MSDCTRDCSCVPWSSPAHNCSPHQVRPVGLLSVTLYSDSRHRFGGSPTWRTLTTLNTQIPNQGLTVNTAICAVA